MLAEIRCDYFVPSVFGKADSNCNLQLIVTTGTLETIMKARTDRLVLSMQRSFSFMQMKKNALSDSLHHGRLKWKQDTVQFYKNTFIFSLGYYWSLKNLASHALHVHFTYQLHMFTSSYKYFFWSVTQKYFDIFSNQLFIHVTCTCECVLTLYRL